MDKKYYDSMKKWRESLMLEAKQLEKGINDFDTELKYIVRRQQLDSDSLSITNARIDEANEIIEGLENEERDLVE
jgi:hypothetical protein